MVEIKEIYPYNENEKLICHYAEDENGDKYYIIQNETQVKFDEAVDIYPCNYTYSATDEKVETEEEGEETDG